MTKTTIMEAQNSDTVYDNGGNGILGKLKGVFADFKNGTRNGGRIYSEELWDNRVFGNEDVMEALNTKTLFGELDHPDGDRCETLAKNAAISITKLEKRPEEGVIYGEAEILDTPTGRIVKALAESGAKLGISSRGMGEEVYYEGKNYIDPETYDFITFDVVVTPANTKARVALTESKHLSKLTEGLKREIEACETENQLNQIKSVVENVNISDKKDLMKTISEKLNVDKKASKIANKITEANNKIALNYTKKKLEAVKAELAESLNANKQLAIENNKLIKESSRLKAMKKVTNENLRACKERLANLNNKYEESMKQVESLEMLKEQNGINQNKISGLVESNKKLSEKLINTRGIITKYKELQKECLSLKNNLQANNVKLTENKSASESEITKLKNRISELEEANKKMEEAKDRFSKLSFNPEGTYMAIHENKTFSNSMDLTQDDVDLYNALVGKDVQ